MFRRWWIRTRRTEYAVQDVRQRLWDSRYTLGQINRDIYQCESAAQDARDQGNLTEAARYTNQALAAQVSKVTCERAIGQMEHRLRTSGS